MADDEFTPDDQTKRLQKGIGERQRELSASADSITEEARRLSNRSTRAKVLLVVLGALTATKSAADTIFGSDTAGNIVFYTLLGVLIATVAGLEGALRLERRSANLTHLAAEARDGLRSIDTRWRISVANEGDPDARARAAGELLTEQNSKLEHVHREAARNGLDLPFEKPAELPDAPVRTKPVVGPDGPYAA